MLRNLTFCSFFQIIYLVQLQLTHAQTWYSLKPDFKPTSEQGNWNYGVSFGCGVMVVGNELENVELKRNSPFIVPIHKAVEIRVKICKMNSWEDNDQVQINVGSQSFNCVGPNPDCSHTSQFQDTSLSFSIMGQLYQNIFTPETWALQELSIRYQCYDTCDDCSTTQKCICNQAGKFLDQQSERCVTTCPSSYFGDNTKHLCVKCHSSCKECFNETQQGCKVCSQENYYISNNSCQKCPVNQYSDLIKCFQCPSGCSTCKNSTECTSCDQPFSIMLNKLCGNCETNQYIDNQNKCQKCHSDCKRCSGPDQKQCIQCVDPNKFITSDTNICNNCKQNEFGNTTNFKCESCHPDCASCNGPKNSQCLICSNTSLFHCQNDSKCQKSCIQCAQNCNECFGEASNQCKGCSIGILQPDFTCQKKCLVENQFYDELTNTCIKCHDYCLKCENASTCSKCDIFNKEKNVNQINNETCAICELNEYYDNGLQSCQKCHSTCATCVGGNENECSSCNDQYFQAPQNTCVTSCPTGLIENKKTKKCQKCVYVNQTCYLECPDRYYQGYEYKCLECPSNCRKCDSEYNCLDCYIPYARELTQDPNVIIQRYQCKMCNIEQGQYINQNGICDNCDENCLECSNNKTCLQCKFKYEIKEGRCEYNAEQYLNIDCDDEQICQQQRNVIKYMKIPAYALVLSSVFLYLWGLVYSDKKHISLNCIYLMQSIGNYSVYQSSLSYNGFGTVILKSLNYVNVLNIFPRPQFASDLELKDQEINTDYRLLQEDKLESLNQDISNFSFTSRMLYFPFYLIGLSSTLFLLFHYRKMSKIQAKHFFVNGILIISNYGIFSLLICLKHIVSNQLSERYALEISSMACFAILLLYSYFSLIKQITSHSSYSIIQGYDLNEKISWSKYFWPIYDLRRVICIIFLAMVNDINVWKSVIIISINFTFFTIIAIWRPIKTKQNYVFFIISELVQIAFLFLILFAHEVESLKQYFINAAILILIAFLLTFLIIIVFNILKYSKQLIHRNKLKSQLLEAKNNLKCQQTNNLQETTIIQFTNVKWTQNPTTKFSQNSP